MRHHTRSAAIFALLPPALLLLGLATLATPAFAAPAPKVAVCHVPPGNPANAHTLKVSAKALPAHLAHGDFAVGAACSEGLGECRAEGTTQCDAADRCSATPGEPSDEVCDGLDNDCNGAVDDGPVDDGGCTAGVGECAVDGYFVCTGGSMECDAIPGAPPETTEISCTDGRDNDCDGLIDLQDTDCAPPCFDVDDIAGAGIPVAVDQCNELASCGPGVCAGTFQLFFIPCSACAAFGDSDGDCDSCAAFLASAVGCLNICPQ